MIHNFGVSITTHLAKTFSKIVSWIMTNKDALDFLLSMGEDIAIIIAILFGYGYIKQLREKMNSASFSYWTQISIRLNLIKEWLESEEKLLINLYSKKAKNNWPIGSIDNTTLQLFKGDVLETIEFMKITVDQMPVYVGWDEDYINLFRKLQELIIFDIENSIEHFKFHEECSYAAYEDYRNQLIKLLSNMGNEILKNQEKNERKALGWFAWIKRKI